MSGFYTFVFPLLNSAVCQDVGEQLCARVHAHNSVSLMTLGVSSLLRFYYYVPKIKSPTPGCSVALVFRP